MQEKNKLKIDWASHESSKYACVNWHYSKSVPVPPLVKIGVWENEKFIGVVIFSRGACRNLLVPYGLTQDEGCELTRIALTKHEAPVSKIISIAIKFLKKNSPALKLIVSFADPKQGHHGGVYQATNWIYTGLSSKGKEYWHKGKKLHSRQVAKKGYTIQQGNVRKSINVDECRIVKIPGKHRYLMPLTSDMRKKILPLSQDYPKRAGNV